MIQFTNFARLRERSIGLTIRCREIDFPPKKYHCELHGQGWAAVNKVIMVLAYILSLSLIFSLGYGWSSSSKRDDRGKKHETTTALRPLVNFSSREISSSRRRHKPKNDTNSHNKDNHAEGREAERRRSGQKKLGRNVRVKREIRPPGRDSIRADCRTRNRQWPTTHYKTVNHHWSLHLKREMARKKKAPTSIINDRRLYLESIHCNFRATK